MRTRFCPKEGTVDYCVVSPPMFVSTARGRHSVVLTTAGILFLATVLAVPLLGCGQAARSGDKSITPGRAAIPSLALVLAPTNRPSGRPNCWPPLQPIHWDGHVFRSRRANRARRKIRRTRADIERERMELFEKTQREIDALVGEFHAKLPRDQARSIGSCYARYSSRFQDSITDQVRSILEAALAMEIFIPREHVYVDMAVRGYQDRRPGLTALREAIKDKKFDAFLIFTTSRLFRRTYKALQFVEEELVERGIRGVFLKSGIDTSDGDNWRPMFQMLAAMDEAMVRMHAAHIRASHEGLFIRGMVCTSLPLGFTGAVVPGEFTKQKRPRRRIIVDPETARWIVRLFEWYVVHGKSIDEIARELNDDPEAPAPAKSLTGLWTHTLVRKHLTNPCYRGFWGYGAAETRWSSDKDYAQRIPRPEPLRSGQFENLRIISDETYFKAQDLLAREVSRSGRRPKDRNRKARPRLLRGLFFCPEHGRQLAVGGAHGSILFCPLCRVTKAAKRPLFTHLNRALAIRLTCAKLAELVRPNDDLVAEIIAQCRREAEAPQKPDPVMMERLQAQAEKLSKKIAFNRRNPGDTPEEETETAKLLKELQAERSRVLADLAAHEAAGKRTIVPPTFQETVEVLAELEQILVSATNAETDDEMRVPRRIIDELTGGRIELLQMGQRKAQQGWLQGRFRVRLLSFLAERVAGVRSEQADQGMEVVIDYREPSQTEIDSERAKKLDDEGLMRAQIANRLGCSRSRVTALLKHWHESRGLEMPDGRSRRASLKQKHIDPPLYQRIADEVMALCQQGMLLQEISDRLQVDRNTITSTVRWWHEARGLPVPDGRTRRKGLDRKTTAKVHVPGELQDSP